MLTRRRAASLALVLVASAAPALTLAAGGAVAAAPAFGIADSVTNVRPTVTPVLPQAASLTAARNEYESFQIVVAGPVAGVSVTGDLFGWDSTSLYREEYYTATQQSDREGGIGRWGDALIPDVDLAYGEKRNAFPFDVPAGENRVVWVDLHVPVGTPAGDYSGALQLSSAGGTTPVPVSVEVLPLTLPSTSTLKSVFMTPPMNGGANTICDAHTGSGTCGGDLAKHRTLNALYTRTALENRITVPNGFGLRPDESPATWTQAAWEDEFEAPLIRGEGQPLPSSRYRLSGARMTTVVPYAYTADHCLTACADAWEAEATEAGQDFSERVSWYACDEPGNNAAAWAACRTSVDQTRSGWARPGLVTATWAQWAAHGQPNGFPASTLVPYVGYMQPKGAASTRGDYDAWLNNSPDREVWLYTSCMASGCASDADPASNGTWTDGWPSYQIDAPANQARAMAWMSDRFRTSGELYWGTTHSLATAWDEGEQFYEGANGDGTLFYPGTVAKIGGVHPIPVESVRLKRLRDGREDYEYLHHLREQGKGAEVDAIVSALYPTMDSATPNRDGSGPSSLLAAREQIVALVRAGGGEPPASTGRILFTSDRDGDREIYNMAANGTDVRQMTFNTVPDDFATWDATSANIYWEQAGSIWTMAADGSGRQVVRQAAGTRTWSKPTVKRATAGAPLLYSVVTDSAVPDSSSIEAFRLDLGTASTLAAGYDPAASASGDVFFSKALFGGQHIYTASTAGTLTEITYGPVDEAVDVSADGDQITYSKTNLDYSSPYDVWVRDSQPGPGDGGAVISSPGNDYQSAFSPDGAALVFVSDRGGDAEIFTSTTTGEAQVALTSNTATELNPSWGTPSTLPPLPERKPSVPGTPSATAGDGAAVVSWTASTDLGIGTGFAYVVTAQRNGDAAASSHTCTTTTLTCTVTGLANLADTAEPYRFTVVARNSAGSSPATELSNPVRPQGPPPTPPPPTPPPPPPTYRPDASVGTVGAGIVNATGAGQVIDVTVPAGSSRSVAFTVTNAGDTADTFGLAEARGGQFTAFSRAWHLGAADVTRNLSPDVGWLELAGVTPLDSRSVQLTVSVPSGTPGGTVASYALHAYHSPASAGIKDVVVLRVTSVAGPPPEISFSKLRYSGQLVVGQRLRAKVATTPSTVKLTYRWLRGSKVIAGAKKRTYVLTRADRRKRIRLKVTASAAGYVKVTDSYRRRGRVK